MKKVLAGVWSFFEEKMLARSFVGFAVATVLFCKVPRFPWWGWVICYGLFLSFQGTMKFAYKWLDIKGGKVDNS